MDNPTDPPDVTAPEYQRLAMALSKIGRNHPYIGLTDPDEILDRLILTSLLCRPLLDPDRPIADVGTGVGLPGLPLALSAPDHPVVLIDPKHDCIPLIRWVLHQLPTLNVTLVNDRLETTEFPESPPQLVSRAALDWPMLRSHSPDSAGPIIRWGGESVAHPPEDPPDWTSIQLRATHSRLDRPQTLLWWGPTEMFHVKQSEWHGIHWLTPDTGS